MIRVLVSGAAGKMGAEVVRAIAAESDMMVVAAVDTAPDAAVEAPAVAVPFTTDLAAALTESKPDIMVDFTRPNAVARNVALALAAGVHCVVGTTGLSNERLEELAAQAPASTCLFVAPNFAIGAVLMMRFAAEAARWMPHVEITELHHDRKLDAPSGTALRTASLIAQARSETPVTPGAETELVSGARGAEVDGIRVHSVRLPGLVAHQEVLFGGVGQTLSIRHDSIDRTSFMPGVVLAIRETVRRTGLIVGLERYLED